MEEITKNEIKKIKIEENKIDELDNELSNAFEIVQNSFIVQKNVMLSKNSINGDFEEWKKAQKINREKLKKDLKTSENNSIKLINESIVDTLIGVHQAVLNTKQYSEDLKQRTKLNSSVEKGVRLLSKNTLKDFDKSVAKVYKLRNQEPLFDAIYKQTQEGIEKGIKIAYKDKRQISFKAYMEMNVRTTTRQEANKYLFEASKNNGVVFYVCSFFGDCAKDHADYQGKYYYDEDWHSFGYDEETSKQIQEYIDLNNIESYQSVVDNEPFLTTRPNCRHTLRPVVLDDVFTHTDKQMTEEYGIRKGTYKDSNYVDLQNQRKNERVIRNYKTRLEEHKLMYKQNPNPTLKNQIDKDRTLIKKWVEKQEKLISSNSLLKRDKRRENNKILVQDLGAGYQLGLKINGKNMYFKEKIKKDIIKEKNIKQVVLEKDVFPSAFYNDEKTTKNVNILIDKINEQKNANPEVVKMFANLKKLEKENALRVEIKYGEKNKVVNYGFKNEIVLRDLTKNNTKGELEINLHELGHFFDWAYRKKSASSSARYFSTQFENINEIIKNSGSTMSKEIEETFENAKKEYEKIRLNCLEEHKLKRKENYSKYENKEITFEKYRRNANKIDKELNKKVDIERRNLNIVGLEDIYDALSGGKYRDNNIVFYGHGKRYYSDKDAKTLEIFANYVSLSITNPKLVKLLKDDKPELVNALESMVKKINEDFEN